MHLSELWMNRNHGYKRIFSNAIIRIISNKAHCFINSILDYNKISTFDKFIRKQQ